MTLNIENFSRIAAGQDPCRARLRSWLLGGGRLSTPSGQNGTAIWPTADLEAFLSKPPIQQDAALSLARALLNTSPIPSLMFDGDLKVAFATRAFRNTFDIPDDQTEGRSLAEIGSGEWNQPQLLLLLENARADGPEMGDYEADLVRKGQPDRRLVVNVSNIVYGDKSNARVLMTVNDVTHARRVERLNVTLLLEKDNLLREREVLLQEMQHRVANSLQIIASVLMLKARNVSSEETRLHLRDAHDRVMSVAAVQQHLQYTLGDIDLGPYLTKLCKSLGDSMIRDNRRLTISVVADETTISSHDAVSMGLIVTELVINSLKHAFPEGRGGQITVHYDAVGAGWTLSVSDNGVGRSKVISTEKAGLGTSIVFSLAKQLGATVVHTDQHPGVKVSIVNLPALVN